jgi:hypothetical protein
VLDQRDSLTAEPIFRWLAGAAECSAADGDPKNSGELVRVHAVSAHYGSDDRIVQHIGGFSFLPSRACARAISFIRAHARLVAGWAHALTRCTRCSALGLSVSTRSRSRPDHEPRWLDQPEPDTPGDSVALHFDVKAQRLVRGRGSAVRSVRYGRQRLGALWKRAPCNVGHGIDDRWWMTAPKTQSSQRTCASSTRQ